MASSDDGGGLSMSSTQSQAVRDFAALLSFAINMSDGEETGGGGKINFPLRDASQNLPFKIDSSLQDSSICCRVPSLELQPRDCVFFPSSSISLLEEAAASNLRQFMDVSKNELCELPMKLLWNLSKSLMSMVDSRLRFSLAALLRQLGEKQQQNSSGGSASSLLSRMVLQTLTSAYSAGTISPITVISTFRTLAFSDRTEDGEHVVPLVVEVVVDFFILGKTVTVHVEAPGTIQGRFSCPSSLFDDSIKATSSTGEPALLVFADVVIDTSALLQSMMTQAKTVVQQAIAAAAELAVALMLQQLAGASPSFQQLNAALSSDSVDSRCNTGSNNSQKSLAASLMSSPPSAHDQDSTNAILAAACVAAITKNNSASQQTRRSFQPDTLTPSSAVPLTPSQSTTSATRRTASVSGSTGLRDFLAAAARAAASVQAESAPSPTSPQEAAPAPPQRNTSCLPPSSSRTVNSSDGWDALRSQSFAELVAKMLQGKQSSSSGSNPTTDLSTKYDADTAAHTNNMSNPVALPLNHRWNDMKNGPFAALLNTDGKTINSTRTSAGAQTQEDDHKPPAVTTAATASKEANITRNLSNRSITTNTAGGGGLAADHSADRLNLPPSLPNSKAATSQSSHQKKSKSTLTYAAPSTTNASTSTWTRTFQNSTSINGLNLLSAALTSLKRDDVDDEDKDKSLQQQDEMKQDSNRSSPSSPGHSNLRKRALDNGAMLGLKTNTSSPSSTSSSPGGGIEKRSKNDANR